MDKNRFESINGLRAYAAIGIVLMHVLVNGQYIINSTANKIIMVLTELVLLFLIVSGFSMCCGYYDKMKNNEISLNDFYKKRYKKIWPYFFILVILDVLISRNITSLMEGFADLTLVFGLLPNNNLAVIGVGWTLGVIFLFYMIFPFFVFLLDNKKRAWFVLILSIIFNILCSTYFFESKFVVESFVPRHHFLFCFMYFVAGGIIYLYKEKIIQIAKKWRYIFLITTIILSIMAVIFSVGNVLSPIKWLLIFSMWLIYAIGTEGKILSNKFTKFISNISLEIYLTHMVIFRVLEKINLTHIFGKNLASYLITFLLTFIGAAIFAILVQKMFSIVSQKINEIKSKNSNAKTIL